MSIEVQKSNAGHEIDNQRNPENLSTLTAADFWHIISKGKYKDKDMEKYEICPKAIQNVLSNIPKNQPLLRKQAAKIVHTYVRDVLGIPDETDKSKIEKALKLKDIYDCRVCVESIIQVYSRGIMKAYYEISDMKEFKAFGGNEEMTIEEAELIEARMEEISCEEG